VVALVALVEVLLEVLVMFMVVGVVDLLLKMAVVHLVVLELLEL
jgi:hypothetical protein